MNINLINKHKYALIAKLSKRNDFDVHFLLVKQHVQMEVYSNQQLIPTVETLLCDLNQFYMEVS